MARDEHEQREADRQTAAIDEMGVRAPNFDPHLTWVTIVDSPSGSSRLKEITSRLFSQKLKKFQSEIIILGVILLGVFPPEFRRLAYWNLFH